MPLVGALELLVAAERGGYAVPGFNVSNVEMALGVLDAAEAHGAPLFLQFNPANIDHIGGLAIAAAVGRTLAARATVPVALHLDHAPTVALLRQAIRAGFTSLMFDGSTFPLERNRREIEARLAQAGATIDEIDIDTEYAFRVKFRYDGSLKTIADYIEDVTDYWETKLAAGRCHVSQIKDPEAFEKRRREQAEEQRSAGNGALTEGFKRISYVWH